ncbi:LysR family transcriptional regulator [Streptacidiphilus sp. N1-12]|uniref:LysR family transcriptional regulator n=2 Tax=Streptacidiphilus alkalitolerans TaxID=3342712 RepID=A0ABV6V366_9ACTN
MELRQLEYFVAVAEEANFTRAAERVHISQSGVSAQIRQLEQELGAQLLDRAGRSGRTATLTQAGAAALGHARAALASADALQKAVDEVNGLVRGRLVVGMVTACTVTPLFDALAAFHRSHPSIQITLVEDTSDQLVERVRDGALDLALIGASGTAPAGLDALPIVSERLVALVPPDHPLAARSRTTLDRVCAHPIVCLPQGTGIRTVFDAACAAAGLRPDIALQASAPTAVADLAARGLGVAVLSESMASLGSTGSAGSAAVDCADRLVAVPIEDVDTPAVLALVWTATGGPALRELLLHCRREFTPSI